MIVILSEPHRQDFTIIPTAATAGQLRGYCNHPTNDYCALHTLQNVPIVENANAVGRKPATDNTTGRNLIVDGIFLFRIMVDKNCVEKVGEWDGSMWDSWRDLSLLSSEAGWWWFLLSFPLHFASAFVLSSYLPTYLPR